jgi:DNA-binding transcriptional regulator YiaG
MAKLVAALNEEIRRLARKEIREQVGKTMKQVAGQRKELAALKRQVASQKRRIDFLENREKKRLEQPPAPRAAKAASGQTREEESAPRFSPKWLSSHREKLGFSAADYATLVGCSPLSIYKWEKGESTPRAAQREALANVRGIGKREAEKRLALLSK